MTLILDRDGVQIHQGDCLETLAKLPNRSVHCCVTSPPYWGLRSYGTDPSVWGGDMSCEHEWESVSHYGGGGQPSDKQRWQHTGSGPSGHPKVETGTCQLCGAWLGSLGLEPTPELYVQHIVEVFREVRRVLRDDATLWLNLGDSYATGAGKANNPGSDARPRGDRPGSAAGKAEYADFPACQPNRMPIAGLKPKDLVGIPWRVAFALQADGWFLRQDIIWAKPAPMPESVRDRCTKAHEYIFLLSKSQRYYFDSEAIAEPSTDPESYRARTPRNEDAGYLSDKDRMRTRVCESANGKSYPTRNKRSVWTVNTKPYPKAHKAHFATFPPKLIEPCILAGCPAACCSKCGAPWVRVTQRVDKGYDGSRYGENAVNATGGAISGGTDKSTLGSSGGKLTGATETMGFEPTCQCGEGKAHGTVLDPFLGSGTTAEVAQSLGRRSIGIELNPDYCSLAADRFKQRILFP